MENTNETWPILKWVGALAFMYYLFKRVFMPEYTRIATQQLGMQQQRPPTKVCLGCNWHYTDQLVLYSFPCCQAQVCAQCVLRSFATMHVNRGNGHVFHVKCPRDGTTYNYCQAHNRLEAVVQTQ